ncbi:c-type cytochrome [Methylocapsa polymorpha]|uniref:C-type cytochrome n=1 Tax=Methylocapsa polymorpha TaxID=3080828 RepID=A0ABZ0HWC7_9HYPH|nr:c-type cytochrome [Methylocapsa sp. RX1]
MTSKEEGRIMKVISLRLALQTAVLAIVFSASGRADEIGAVAFSKSELQAKLEYCKTCHGLSGQGYRGYFAMPRLAGQQPKYLENQLRAFIEHRRTNSVMFNVAHALSPSMVSALAAHFRELDPNPIGGAPKERLALGKTIFEEGLPEANVPACSACHGPEAKGQDEIPRLAGQLFPYTVKVLTNWGKERGLGSAKDISAIMVPTTHNLNQSQIAAIAAYVSHLK